MDPVILIGGLLIGLSLILYGFSAEEALKPVGWTDIDAERARSRSRNSF